MRKRIDINCDLGEGLNNDEALMPYISSCNIACGGHYGDKESILKTIKLAKRYRLKVGAHPSFPDQKNFGRQMMKIKNSVLKKSIIDQVMLFKNVCESENVRVNHIKLHGALYNYAVRSSEMADLIIESLLETGIECILYTPYDSELALKGKHYFKIINEAFIDRTYNEDLSLMNRSSPEAIISEPKQAWNQLCGMIKHNEVISAKGQKVVVIADTYCIHGDNKNAINIMDYIYNQLQNLQIQINNAEA